MERGEESTAMSDLKSFSVPKFSSFRPKAPAPVIESKSRGEKEPRQRESRDPHRNHRERSRSRSHERRQHRQKDERPSSDRREARSNEHHRSTSDLLEHGHRRHGSRSRSPPRKELARRHRSRSPKVKKPAAEPISAPASTSFIIDRKGDPQNLTYGRIHRYDVPRFRRVGFGNVMGLPRRFKMQRGLSDEADGIIIVDSKQGVGKREKYAFARNEKKGARLLRIKPVKEDGSEDPWAQNGDFIPLSKPKKRKRSDSGSTAEGDYEKHFQLIEMSAAPESKPEDENLEYATESDYDAEGRTIKVDKATRQEHIELSRAVDKDPSNIEAWLALINHQDAMLGLGEFAHRKITTAEIQSTAEIKISMYEKALKTAGTSLPNRERLLLGMMKDGAKIWSQDEQSERWEKLTRREVGSSLLWKSYVDFRMSDFQDFMYDDIKQLFQDRLKLLVSVKQRTIEKRGTDDMAALEVIHQQMVYVLIRATLFMREEGHTELSVAIWQAVLEYNLSCHRDYDGAKEDNFDEFWDSDVPRIGEEGAKGWKEFTDIDMEEAPEPRRDPELPPSFDESADALSGWAKAERFRAAASRWPAKTCDETVEDDPYRVILWSDIQEFLVDLGYTSLGHWQISPTAHRMLVDGFLIFCRLPPVIRGGFPEDPFIFDDILESSTEHIQRVYLSRSADQEEILNPVDAVRNDARNEKAQKDIFDAPSQEFVFTTDTLFPSPHRAASLPRWNLIYGSEPSAGPIDITFVQHSLDTLSRTYPTDELGEYYLAWMFLHSPSSTPKVAKSLISKRPQSRILYNAFALILWNLGQKEKAIGVWNQVLAMPDTPAKAEKINDILLWKSRIWCHLDDGDSEMALKCLLSIRGDAAEIKNVDVTSSTLHLRAKQHFSSSRDFLLGSGQPALAALEVECLALLYYLSPQNASSHRDIEGALGVIDHFTASLKSYNHHLSSHHEVILQFSGRLLWHHVRTGPFRPLLIRERMMAALELFPKNTIFMSLYAWNESRARIDDRVRAILRDVALIEKNDCVTSRLFAIRYEVHRGNVHSIRAAFEYAVASEACKSNAGLWRLYVLWCADNADAKVKVGAKEVLYRGMRDCPGVKPLMMEAFETLRPLMTDDEVKSVYKVMEEKDVRIHVDLEEWLEEHGGSERE